MPKKSIPQCTEHKVCQRDVGPANITPAEVEQVLECLFRRGIIEIVKRDERGEPHYRFTEEYRD